MHFYFHFFTVTFKYQSINQNNTDPKHLKIACIILSFCNKPKNTAIELESQ